MEPTFRDQLLEMTERLRAEDMVAQAQVIRVAMAEQEQYDRFTSLWEAFARGEDADMEYMDPRGRPVTDSFEEFAGFARYDRATLLKRGVIEKNEYFV